MVQLKLEVPKLLCPSKKEIAYVCTNSSCKARTPSTVELKTVRPFCSTLHLNCTEIRQGKFSTMIQGSIEDNRNLILGIIEEEKKMIEKI